MHSSSSRGILSSRDLPHPLLLHVAPAGISASGSSDSSSGGSGLGVEDGTGCSTAARLMDRGFVTGAGAGGGAAETALATSSAAGLGGGAGVSSTVECLPVVQGGMARNSSNVSTRGLQHFHPTHIPNVRTVLPANTWRVGTEGHGRF